MNEHTPVWYATVSGITGLCFHVGATQLFTPTESDTVYVVPAGAAVVITARVPDLFARFLRETVIEKRLSNLGGAR
jgi:hypothetical protein